MQNHILWVDEKNLTVHVESGIIGQDLERRVSSLVSALLFLLLLHVCVCVCARVVCVCMCVRVVLGTSLSLVRRSGHLT